MQNIQVANSAIYKISISDRYLDENGIIRSKMEDKYFSNSIEADKFYIENKDIHYFIQYDRMDIHITTIFNEEFNCHNEYEEKKKER